MFPHIYDHIALQLSQERHTHISIMMCISLTEGIMVSYLRTIPSCREYFDSNAADVTDDDQTLPKTETGQTVSTNHKDGIQSRAYPSNESLGRSESLLDYQRTPRIRIVNTNENTIEYCDRGKEHQPRNYAHNSIVCPFSSQLSSFTDLDRIITHTPGIR